MENQHPSLLGLYGLCGRVYSASDWSISLHESQNLYCEYRLAVLCTVGVLVGC